MDNKNVEAIYPLSPMQEGLLFHSVSEPASGAYLVQSALAFEGQLHSDELRRAWQHVVERHAVLRTAFLWDRVKEPLQVVRRRVTLPWKEMDWRSLSREDQEQRLEAFLQSDRDEGFDLTAAPLMRLTLVRTGGESYQQIWSFHHLILDGWSSTVLQREVSQVYQALCGGRAPVLEAARPYREYVTYLQEHQSSVSEAYWRHQLAGFTTPTTVGLGSSRGRSESVESCAERRARLSDEATAALVSFARENRVTVNTVVRGAWALLLSRYSDTEDVLFGVTTSGRPPELEGVESMVGLFINTVPSRVRVPPDEPLSTWLRSLQEQQADLLHHEHIPLTQVSGWSDVPRGTPLFETLLVFESDPAARLVWSADGRLTTTGSWSAGRTHYPLALAVVPGPPLSILVEYHRHRFEPEAIERMLGHLDATLRSMASRPGQRVGEVEYLADVERRRLVEEWNPERRASPSPRCVHERFEEQAARAPERIAVKAADGELTYGELNARANQVAHYLGRLGVGPSSAVGLAMERSLEMVVGLLGILKAGGAYVPLDPSHPPQRLASVIRDARVPVVLTQHRLRETLPKGDTRYVAFDTEWADISREPTGPAGRGTTNESLAYIIYTSGSTGQPKGVMIEHGSTADYLAKATREYALTPEDHILQFAAISFDTSVEEFLITLACGATLILRTDSMSTSVEEFVRGCEGWGVTVLDLPTAFWHELVVALSVGSVTLPSRVRLVVIGGERAQPERVEEWVRAVSREVRLLNTYGPAEATIVATWGDLTRDGQMIKEAPIGRPIPGVRAYVLNQRGDLVPQGVPGELCIGGVGLARGYLGQADRTAERFVPDAFSGLAGARLYRTGDLVRHLPDGSLAFVGRIGHQVKVRGFRIELEEIESVLRRHPEVREAVVTAPTSASGPRTLAAYIVPRSSRSPSSSDLGRFLGEQLPSYMVPPVFVNLESLPLNSSGKVDRRALPAPEAMAIRGDGYVAPRTPTEKVLVGIWKEVLGVERVGIEDDFFRLGGHSLSAMRIASRVRQALGAELPLRELLGGLTVSRLAAAVEASSTRTAEGGTQAERAIPRISRRARKSEKTGSESA